MKLLNILCYDSSILGQIWTSAATCHYCPVYDCDHTVHRLSYISYTAISRQDVSKIHLFCSYFVLILYHELLTTWRGQFVYLRVTVWKLV